ncbi:VC0807 family protein [Streptomyces sp. NPDC058000]|uniref:VC0807 family protein n=1 Tax=Streptomyces sp. NPDC058000 TaxID=3346299 RepID=UPI0036E0C4C7
MKSPASTSPHLAQKLRALAPMILDLVIPIAGFYVLHQMVGLSQVWALTLAGAAGGAWTLIHTIQRRKLDVIGLLVVLEMALTVGLLFISDDPRLVAAKPSFYTLLAAVYLLFTCVAGRPLVYVAATPMATDGDPGRTVAYEQAWERSKPFRARERAVTAAFGLAALIDAVLRVVVVYSYDVDKFNESFLLSQLPGIALIVVVLVFTKFQIKVLHGLVDEVHDQLAAEGVIGPRSDAHQDAAAPAPAS